MSWIVRDPPSPFADNSSKLKDIPPETGWKYSAPFTDSRGVEEQWSTNPLRIKSTFSTTGTGIRSVTSPACGMGWTFNLSPDLPAESASRGRRGGRKLPKRDTNAVRILASLRPSPAGFQPGTLSIRASFRRDDCVLAVLSVQQHSVLKGQSTISLGRCDIPLPPTPTPTPLNELFIDVNVIILLQSGPVEDPQKLSVSMTKAIRASLDGNFPVDVKFMLFSRKSGGTSVCRRRPIYASSSILKGRNSLLDSYMNGSRGGDDPPSPGVCQYTYDEDSDLESDLDEDPSRDVPEMSDITAREDPLSRPLSPVNITDLDTVQSMPPDSPSGKISPVASIFGVDGDSSPFSVIPCENSPTMGLGSPPRSDSIRMSEYDKAESPVCDVQADESMGRCAEEYQADTMKPQKEVPAPLLHLALINDVAFRTFRALIVYMYTKEAAFIPLKSSGGRSYNVGDACSPKSMYRLAVKASHGSLKKHAFDNLRSQLGPKNIIAEIFSKFTAEYPEIFEMELLILLDHFTDPAVRDEWERMIDTVVNGHLPRGADILKKVTRALRT
ncbi:uncharacterized protein ARMOST_21161 [Armillaria ostoyae]|uniref:BTB domain-containing protein n=1 Tax=Armillaria ostoyae TaxID=47428 RepID=A0A284S9C2_ARMOS|nr:uncharacterized protein ARMOST_21161 [Armillaria ostoyae]